MHPFNIPANRTRFFNGVIIVSLLVIATLLVRYHYRIITFPFPSEYREGASIQETDALLNGVNPFLIKNQPQHTTAYGIFYNLVVYPFAKIFGSGLVIHRAVAGLFILLSCLIVYLFAKKRKTPLLFSIAIVLMLYASLLALQTSLARPDSLGLFLFLSGLYIPFRNNYSYKSLFISAFIGVVAFFTKSFFLLLYPFLASYLFLFVSKKKGIIFAFVSFLVLTTTIISVNNYFFETYIANCFYIHLNIGNFNFPFLLYQTKVYLLANAGIVLLLAWSIISFFLRSKNKVNPNQDNIKDDTRIFSYPREMNFLNLDKALFSEPMYCITYYFIFSIFVLLFKLGGHDGAFMTYFYQLLSPFLLLVLFEFTRERKPFFLTLTIILVNLFFFYFKFLPHYSKEEVGKQWGAIEKIITENKSILNSPAVAPLLQSRQKNIYDSGQSEFFIFNQTPTRMKSIPFIKNYDKEILQRIKSFSDSMCFMVAEKKFEIIMRPNYYDNFIPQSLLEMNYYCSDILRMPMPHCFQNPELFIWRPK